MAIDLLAEDSPIDLLAESTVEETPSLKNKLINYLLKINLSPSTPPGINIGTGLLSLATQKPEQKEIIRNLYSTMMGREPTGAERFEQGIGEYLPLSLVSGSAPGLLGSLGRIAGTGLYGGAVRPEDRIGGLEQGLMMGALGEAIPATIKGIGSIAEKIRPVKYVKDKMAEMINVFAQAENTQKMHYGNVTSQIGKEKVTNNPYRFVGSDKNNLSEKSKEVYDQFMKDRSFNTLHKFQYQLFRDAKKYGGSKEAEGIAIRDKAELLRNKLINKVYNFLETKFPNLYDEYKAGADITKNIIKPFEGTKAVRDIIRGRTRELSPEKYKAALHGALKKEGIEIPKEHYLRSALEELEPKLQLGKFIKKMVPPLVKKMSPIPDIFGAAQIPMVEDIVRASNLLYEPLRAGMIGKELE